MIFGSGAVISVPRVRAFPSTGEESIFIYFSIPRSTLCLMVQAERKCAIFDQTTNASNSIFLKNLQ